MFGWHGFDRFHFGVPDGFGGGKGVAGYVGVGGGGEVGCGWEGGEGEGEDYMGTWAWSEEEVSYGLSG